jgi:hypothetical protein
MSSLDTRDPRDSSYGRDYWLHRCEGFTVQRVEREIGKVTGLRFRSSIEPELLEVRNGLFGKRLLIPVEQVQQIDPKARRIVLDASPISPPLNNALKLSTSQGASRLTPLAKTDVNGPGQ